jgi:parvulin-like peptidyl-prolyl isomerase
MKNKMKLVFSAVFAVAMFTLSRANAVTADATMLAATATNSIAVSATTSSAATDTNNNPIATMASLFPDLVIAKGNGFEIKQSELDEVMTGIKSSAAAQGQTIPPEQLVGYEVQMLNRLIQIQILLQKATDEDKAAGKAKADTQLAALLERAGSQEVFERQLKAVGITPDELRAKVTQEATATATLTRELGVSTADDSTVKDFYTAHPEDFEQPEMVHVRHILLLTMDSDTRAPLPDNQIKAKRAQIDDILKRARAGEDFATLARQYSEDPGSKDDGGELPPFGHNGQMVPEFEAAAFALETNQISDVVTTSYGYHIIKLLDKTPSTTLKLTDKVPSSDMTVADKIKDYLTQQKTDELAPAFLDKLKKDANVEILDADLKAAAASAEAEAAAMAAATNAAAARVGNGDGGTGSPTIADTNAPAK